MNSNILLENTILPKDIIEVILDYKYQLELKNYFDSLFKDNIITYFNHVINTIEEPHNLTQLLYYLQNYITDNDFITKYTFHFRIINCLGTTRLNSDIDKYIYYFSDIQKLYHLGYYYYRVSRISFERSSGNNKVYITIFDMDDIKHSKIDKKSRLQKLKKIFKSFIRS